MSSTASPAWLLPPGDVPAWTAAITDAMQNTDEIARWSRASLETAPQFDAEKAVVAYEALMREQIARAG